MGLKDLILGGLTGRTGRTGGEFERLNIDSLDASKIGIYRPVTFYDITKLVRIMGKNTPLIVNFMELKPTEAGRSLDFVCGGVCALGGRFEKIGDGIYFFAPKKPTLNTDKKYKRT